MGRGAARAVVAVAVSRRVVGGVVGWVVVGGTAVVVEKARNTIVPYSGIP